MHTSAGKQKLLVDVLTLSSATGISRESMLSNQLRLLWSTTMFIHPKLPDYSFTYTVLVLKLAVLSVK